MADFIRTEKKVVNVGEPITFENNTDSDFSVSAAIVFRKSGLYDVSIVGRRTIISKVAERKNEPVGCNGCRYGWFGDSRCSKCARSFQDYYEADMRGIKDGYSNIKSKDKI